eukprot:364915-Chlamydomonas_euryale.AAC.36
MTWAHSDTYASALKCKHPVSMHVHAFTFTAATSDSNHFDTSRKTQELFCRPPSKQRFWISIAAERQLHRDVGQHQTLPALLIRPSVATHANTAWASCT